MRTYEKYNDSGVEWIGEIPESWDCQKLRRISNVKRGASPRPIDDPKYFDDNGEYSWVRIADVTASEKYLTNTKEKLSELGASLSVKRQSGDLILSIAATVGKPIIAKIKCCIHDGFVYFPDLTLNVEFLYYLFLTGQAYFGLGKWGTQLNLNSETVSEIYVPIPSNEEQTAIANYLDSKTTEIDQVVVDKEALVNMYEEEKKALINEAVTKGLNPEVKFKPSNIDWLGDVPEHWEAVPLTKYLDSIVDYRGRTPNKIEEGVFLVTAKNVKNGIIDYKLSEEYVSAEEQKEFMKRGDVKIGDVLFTTEAPLGEIANIDRTDICLAQRIIKFRANEYFLNNYFLKFWLRSYSFQQDLQTYATGSTAIGIKASKLNNLVLVLPPLSEQTAIVHHIESETANINDKINQIKQEIALLKEYRQALIFEAVTGKVRVFEG